MNAIYAVMIGHRDWRFLWWLVIAMVTGRYFGDTFTGAHGAVSRVLLVSDTVRAVVGRGGVGARAITVMHSVPAGFAALSPVSPRGPVAVHWSKVRNASYS